MPLLFWAKKRYPSEKLGNDEESCTDSWVELAPPSRGSICSSVDILAQFETDRDDIFNIKSSHNSPKSQQLSPHVELERNLEQVKFKLANEFLQPERNTDWIWDWSSRPEIIPPKSRRFRPINRCGSSSLTTPPNSPVPSSTLSGPLDFRHSKMINSAFFHVEVLIGLVISNIVTFFLGAAIGICLCKRLTPKKDIL